MLNKIDTQFVNQAFLDALCFELEKYKNIDFQYVLNGAPETGKAIYDMFVNSKRYGSPFRVFCGANDAENLYFAPETNLLYRTLHDLHHAEAYSVGVGGTTKIKDELRLNCKMSFIAFSYTLSKCNLEDALAVFFAVYHDTVGQVHYYAENADFCINQKANTIALLNECRGIEFLNLGRVNQARQVMQNYMLECGFTG